MLRVQGNGLLITVVQILMEVLVALPMPPAMYILQEGHNLQAASPPAGIRTALEEVLMPFW